jgi:hypothetical protein
LQMINKITLGIVSKLFAFGPLEGGGVRSFSSFFPAAQVPVAFAGRVTNRGPRGRRLRLLFKLRKHISIVRQDRTIFCKSD